MKPITERQIEAIEKLARATRTSVGNVEQLSSFEASKVITSLIEKMNKIRNNSYRNNYRKPLNNHNNLDVLAGLAVKILAQKSKEEEMIGKAENFKKRVVELYRVFCSARQACLA